MTTTDIPAVPFAATIKVEVKGKRLRNFPHSVTLADGTYAEPGLRVQLADGRQATVTRTEVNSGRVVVVPDSGPTPPNGYVARSAKTVIAIRDKGRVIKSGTKVAARLAAEAALEAAEVEDEA